MKQCSVSFEPFPSTSEFLDAYLMDVSEGTFLFHPENAAEDPGTCRFVICD